MEKSISRKDIVIRSEDPINTSDMGKTNRRGQDRKAEGFENLEGNIQKVQASKVPPQENFVEEIFQGS